MKSKFTVATIFLVISFLTSCQKEPNVSIQIDCGEQNSEETFLTVKGKQVGQCPLDIKVVAGEINIQAQRDYKDTSYRHIEKNVTLAENTTKKISLDMSKLQRPEKAWFLRVKDISTAEEYIENNPNGSHLNSVNQKLSEYMEAKIWTQSKGDLESLEHYVKAYPNGQYTKLANTKLAEIKIDNQRIAKEKQRKKQNKIANEKTGTVTVKKLMWMRCSLGQTWNKDKKTCDGKAKGYTHNQAISKAKNFSYSGYNNWRVPTIEELESIVYCSIGKPKIDSNGRLDGCPKGYNKPTIDQEKFPNTSSDSYFWSASPYAYITNDFQIVSFNYGSSSTDGRSANRYVRLVRPIQ